MARPIRLAALGAHERDELVSDVDEGGACGAAAKRQLEDLRVEVERFVYVADFESHVVDADEASHTAPNARPGRAIPAQAAMPPPPPRGEPPSRSANRAGRSWSAGDLKPTPERNVLVARERGSGGPAGEAADDRPVCDVGDHGHEQRLPPVVQQEETGRLEQRRRTGGIETRSHPRVNDREQDV